MTQEELEELWRDPGRWRAFFFYHCANDPRVIVPKRIRWTGYTINSAHRMAIPVLIGMLLAVLAPFLLLVLLEPPQSVIGVAVAFVAVVSVLVALCHWESTRAR